MPVINDYPSLKLIQEIARREKVDVFLVGGFLRDYLIGNERMDFDFAVERNALKVSRTFAKRIKGAYILLDKERGCARVAKKQKGILQTFDFADYRAKTLKGDLNHRDFTINTMCLDVGQLDDKSEISDVIKDFKNGQKDLKNKKIKMVSSKAFKEDPLRVMRAFSLKASLGFKIEPKTLAQIKKDKDAIITVSPERVRDELFKVLETQRAAENIKMMDKIGLLEKIIPQVSVMFGCKQGTYHHLDVWPHSLETVVQSEKLFEELKDNEEIKSYLDVPLGGQRPRSSLIKLAALLHDIGKPDTRKREKGHISFHGHEHVGRSIVRHIARMLKLSTCERHALEDMVLWHLRPGYLSNFKKPTERAVYRYFRNAREEAVSILLLSLADQRSTRGPATTAKDQKHHEDICMGLVKQYFDKLKEEPFIRIINGNDLIKTLKMKPSPLFGKILTAIDEKQSLGKIKTKKEALDLAKKLARRKTLR